MKRVHRYPLGRGIVVWTAGATGPLDPLGRVVCENGGGVPKKGGRGPGLQIPVRDRRGIVGQQMEGNEGHLNHRFPPNPPGL